MIVRVGGEHRSSTRSDVIEARRFEDSTVFDRMHARGQLSDVQHQAAERLSTLWLAGGFHQRTTPRYGAPGGRSLDQSDADDPDGAHHVLRQLLSGLPSRQAWALTGLMAGQHPGLRLPDLHAALDAAAEQWGLD